MSAKGAETNPQTRGSAKARARRAVGRPGDGEDVRGAILAAALRQLETTGLPDRVTIAAVVDEAGCTPPSLYHYWPRRELLLREASERGWAQFRDSQGDAVADCDDPLERLRLRGRAYLDFALERPALFRVLFLEPSDDGPPSHPRTRRPSRARPSRIWSPMSPGPSTEDGSVRQIRSPPRWPCGRRCTASRHCGQLPPGYLLTLPVRWETLRRMLC